MYEPLEFAIQLAFESGRIQKRYFQKTLSIMHKGEINLVTNVDFECESRILELLGNEYPDDEVISEEKANTYESGKNRWIVDPLDGTTNYAHGYPFFCTSIAYEVDGEIIVGVVYNPITEELFFARKGEGSFLNGERLGVSAIKEIKQALLVTGFPYDVITNPNNNLNHWAAFIMRAQALRRDGSAGLNLSYVAAGRFDGFWEMRLSPWDMAAGVLIVREAGGTVTSLSGETFSLFSGGILASNGLIHKRMLDVIREGS
ncbi:MAG TPA: inositol monophosphatase family protein [Syntrophorhabdales bacterium]|nr:inositol monophosphatase family protein [Syntrophorhabdales bacterium]